MKKILFAATLALSSAAFAQDFDPKATTMQYQAKSDLEYVQAPNDHFTGSSQFARFPQVSESLDGWAIVDFGDSSINNWHSHAHGQYLIITEGTGLVQEWGKPIRVVKKGDVVWFPANVKHWHGAAPNQTMSHIVIAPQAADNSTTWYEAVDQATLEPFKPKADESVKQTTPVTDRQLAIVPIAALTAEGKTDALKTALENGLNAGLTVNEIREIFTHLQAYAGFPRALNGLTAFNQLLKERADKGIQDEQGKTATPVDYSDNYAKGVQALINMGSGAATQGTLFESAGMDYALKANLFGYLFSRDVLSYTDREIVVLATIASLGEGVEAQLGSHLRNTHGLGISTADLSKVLQAVEKVNTKNGENAKKVLAGLKLDK